MSNIEVKESQTHGKGLFAKRDFKKGEIINIWHPKKIVKKEELNQLSEYERNRTSYVGNGKYAVMGEPERFVNHSCEPNIYVKDFNDIALRDIKQGEEITVDYSLNSIDNWKIDCQCKNPNCRKIILGDFRKLDKQTQEKLKPYLEDWFKKEIGIE